MRLTALEAQFIRAIDEDSFSGDDVTLSNAQGILFLCPKCFLANAGAIGTHSMICWFLDRGVPDTRTPLPGRWTPSGSGIDDLTFIGPQAASIQIQGSCNAHFFIRNGAIEDLT